MKKLFVTITILMASLATYAQGTVVNKYFNQLGDDEKFTKVSISSKMFSLFTELEAGSEAEEEFLKAVSKLKGLKIIASDSIGNAAKMYAQALKDVDAAGYDELMSVQDAEENMRFSIKESGGKIEELLMVVGGKKRFVLLSLYGEIDLKNISKIAKGMNVGGLENLSKINEGN
ncbi:MAG: hypothetical protein CMB80_29805 [Flammeovirgaceae bacterium]|nr:hypothetical protein [Flammeovirgaceae bacterium]MBE61595.1 hypothetical protein [Flammeovirgaceae bacterium]MBR10227.1 hypothetical protein [Rickettsiales bacterium]|tara:strand:+ start:616 stop:1137 length:522 start_codon:yes stop_codon:yes gene_type:complete